MLKIQSICETKEVIESLKKKWLLRQYKKSKIFILGNSSWKIDFKLRKPKDKWVWSFRINKQYRAFWRLDWNDLIVYKVYDHSKNNPI